MNGVALGAPRSALARTGLTFALGLCAIAAGAGVTAAATRLGVDRAPLALLALGLAPLLIVGVLSRPLLGVILVLAVFPIGSARLPTPVIELKAVEVAVFAVGALVVLRRLSGGLHFLSWAPPLWWALALFGWTLAATPSALDLSAAFKLIAIFLGGLVFVGVILSSLRDVEDVRWMLAALVTVAAGIAIVAISQGVRFQSLASGETVSGRLQGAFDQPNQLGMFCAVSAATAAGLVFAARTRLGRIASIAALATILVGLTLSLSRGAWVGSALAFLYLLLTLPEARRALLAFGIPVAIAASVFGSFAPGQTEIEVVSLRAHAITTLSPYDARSAIYAEALREITAHPLTGVGPGSFPVASERAGSQSITVFPDHAHDIWLTWGAEVGLPAVALIAAFAISLGLAARRGARGALRRGDRRDRALIAGPAAALIAVLGQGIFDYPLRNAVLWMLVWCLVGALLVCAREHGAFEPAARRPSAP